MERFRYSLRRPIYGNRRRRDSAQNLCSSILQLPAEIILLVVKELPLYQQIIVSQTCRPLRHLLLDSNKTDNDSSLPLLPAHLNKKQRFDFLCALSHSLPNRWVCQFCANLHRVNTRDTPTHPQYLFLCGTGLIFFHSYGVHGYQLEHRHLNLILKYAQLLQRAGNSDQPRLEPKYRIYFDNLMRPFSAPFRPFDPYNDNQPFGILGSYSAHPKVVNGQLLVHCVRSYRKDTEEVSRETMGFSPICQHQASLPLSFLPPSKQMVYDAVEAKERLKPGKAFQYAVVDAFAEPGAEFNGSCIYCETDFSVCASSEGVIVHTWQSLGSEESPFSNSWQLQVRRPKCYGTYSGFGSIRRLYCHHTVSIETQEKKARRVYRGHDSQDAL